MGIIDSFRLSLHFVLVSQHLNIPGSVLTAEKKHLHRLDEVSVQKAGILYFEHWSQVFRVLKQNVPHASLYHSLHVFLSNLNPRWFPRSTHNDYIHKHNIFKGKSFVLTFLSHRDSVEKV